MITLLVVIYVIFISLGLPDSLYSVCWPLMHVDYGVDVSLGSLYSIIIALSTGFSSFCGGALIKRFGTGKVSAFSVLLTAIGMLGTGLFSNFYAFIVFTILSGLGAGAVDTGLNNFISLNYKALHMNWLHCFWGVGVTISPLIGSPFLKFGDWQGAYRTTAYIQILITIIVFISLIFWKKYDKSLISPEKEEKFCFLDVIKTRGVLLAILTLGLYCCIEFLLGTWGSTFLIKTRGFSADVSALYVALYFGAITVSRFVSGIISLKVDTKYIIYFAIGLSAVGIALLFFFNEIITLISILLIGLGFGPIFPSMMHLIPRMFGEQKSVYITGYMTSGAYFMGFMWQVAYGFVAPITTFNIMPYVCAVACILLFIIYRITLKTTIDKAK